MIIKQFNNVSHSPAWQYLYMAYGELHQQGFDQQPHSMIMHNDGVLCASHENGELLGWIVYRPDEARNSWWIMQSFTMPGDRRTGVHTKLFEALVDRARLREITSIDSGTSYMNFAAQNAFKKQGRKLVGYLYAYHVMDPVGKDHTDVS